MSLKDELVQGGHTMAGISDNYHEQVLGIITQLVNDNPNLGSADGDLLDVLSEALIKYDAKYYPITDHEHAIAKWIHERGVRLIVDQPKELVPVYQYRVKQIRGGWFDTDAAGIAELRKHPFDRYEFRTLYKGWE